MKHSSYRVWMGMLAAAGLALLPVWLQRSTAQQPAPLEFSDGDWPLYSRDAASTRFSPLTQINQENVTQLQRIWDARPAADVSETGKAKGKGKGPGTPGFNPEATPIALDGILYVPGAGRVTALDGDTGEELWSFAAPGPVANRSVGYWPGDGQNPPRILFTTQDGDRGHVLMAVNATNGNLDPGFGEEGSSPIEVEYNGGPYIYKNLILIGNNNLESTNGGPKGDTKVFSAQTGELLWTFDASPAEGERGAETWLNGADWQGTGMNVWGWYFTVDEERDLIYMPFGSPGGNYWGGERHGDNLFGNSLVAVNANTGEYVWHFQIVHHDLWDTDLPAAPSLFDVEVDGETIPALAVIGKNALMFILNRETGEPIHGVEERVVPSGDVPQEWYSPTQPFPVKPEPLARMSFSPEDLVTAEDTTPEHAAACLELFERGNYFNLGPYTPFPFHEADAPARSALQFPGNGGPNWGGTAADPTIGYVYVTTRDAALSGWIEAKREGGNYGSGQDSPQPYDRGSISGPGPYSGFTAMGMPCQKPPWARLFAVNAHTGDIAWEIVLGLNERLPEGKQLVGNAGSAGPTVTAGGLVLAPASDGRLRAIDSLTGDELWAGELGGNMNANVMTYTGRSGRQYIAGVVSGAVVAFALPQ